MSDGPTERMRQRSPAARPLGAGRRRSPSVAALLLVGTSERHRRSTAARSSSSAWRCAPASLGDLIVGASGSTARASASTSTPRAGGSRCPNVHPPFVAACRAHDGARRSSAPDTAPAGRPRWWGDPTARARLRVPGARPCPARGGLRAGGDRQRGGRGRRHRPHRRRRPRAGRAQGPAVADALDGAPAIVLGGDTVLDVDGETRGKPPSLDVARAWWASVRGPIGHPALRAVRDRHGHGPVAGGVATTIVHYGHPAEREMDAYLATGEPLRGRRRLHHRRLRGALRRPHRRRPRRRPRPVAAAAAPAPGRDRHRDHRPVGAR